MLRNHYTTNKPFYEPAAKNDIQYLWCYKILNVSNTLVKLESIRSKSV